MGRINGNSFSGKEYGHLEVPTSVPLWFSFNEFPKSLSEDFSLANGCRVVVYSVSLSGRKGGAAPCVAQYCM